MPMDPARYPPDWKAISLRVRASAGNKCQRCGVPNGTYIVRHPDGTWREVSPEWADANPETRVTRIILTVAHTGPNKHEKMDCTHLEALCQRCHLMEDMDDHVRHAAETRRRKRIQAGQTALLESV